MTTMTHHKALDLIKRHMGDETARLINGYLFDAAKTADGDLQEHVPGYDGNEAEVAEAVVALLASHMRGWMVARGLPRSAFTGPVNLGSRNGNDRHDEGPGWER